MAATPIYMDILVTIPSRRYPPHHAWALMAIIIIIIITVVVVVMIILGGLMGQWNRWGASLI